MKKTNEKKNNKGIVYILQNESMPDFIKIGSTNDIKKRMQSLYTTGVPLSFDCVYACEVENFERVEEGIQNAFDDYRINPKREFFKGLAPEHVIAILELLNGKDVTTNVDNEIQESIPNEERAADTAAKKQIKTKRPKLNFALLGIMPGEKLFYKDDDGICVEVYDDTKVLYRDKPDTLTGWTKIIRSEQGKYHKNINGTTFWNYNNKSLDDICDEKLRAQPVD